MKRMAFVANLHALIDAEKTLRNGGIHPLRMHEAEKVELYQDLAEHPEDDDYPDHEAIVFVDDGGIVVDEWRHFLEPRIANAPRERSRLVHRKKTRWHERELRKDDRRIARSLRDAEQDDPPKPGKKPWQTGGHDARHGRDRERFDSDEMDICTLVREIEENLAPWHRDPPVRPFDADGWMREASELLSPDDPEAKEAQWQAWHGVHGDDLHRAWIEEHFDLFLPDELPTPDDILHSFWDGDEDMARDVFADEIRDLAQWMDPSECWDKVLRVGYRVEEIALSIGRPIRSENELSFAEAQAMRDLGARSWPSKDDPDLATDYFWRQKHGHIPGFEDPERPGRFLGPIDACNELRKGPEDIEDRDDEEENEEEAPPSSREPWTGLDEAVGEPPLSEEEIDDIVDPLLAEPDVRVKTRGTSRGNAPRQLKRVAAGSRSLGNRQAAPATHSPTPSLRLRRIPALRLKPGMPSPVHDPASWPEDGSVSTHEPQEAYHGIQQQEYSDSRRHQGCWRVPRFTACQRYEAPGLARAGGRSPAGHRRDPNRMRGADHRRDGRTRAAPARDRQRARDRSRRPTQDAHDDGPTSRLTPPDTIFVSGTSPNP